MVDQVISNNYCVGCGACAALQPEKYSMSLNRHGFLQAVDRDSDLSTAAIVSQSCPFSDHATNEDELAKQYLTSAFYSQPGVGNFLECLVGRVSCQQVYGKSSSGGIARWVLRHLLEQGMVDTVLHVSASADAAGNLKTADSNLLYGYSVASSPEDISATAKSAYYPVEMSSAIDLIMTRPGRYAITGVPCFIKALRNIASRNSVFAERLKFTIGIVCGHLKSTYYAELLGWQLGVPPEDLGGLDFRVKIPGCRANEKGVSAKSKKVASIWSKPKKVQELFGTNYGHGYFKYKACDFCDDVMAETADISVGDAWLPEFMESGTSIAVIRNSEISECIRAGIRKGELQMKPIQATRVALSQEAGLRHRRDGLAYRLFLKARDGKWTPRKRVKPSINHLTRKYRTIFAIRIMLAEKSIEVFESAKKRGQLEWFINKMKKLNAKHDAAYLPLYKNSMLFRLLKRMWAARAWLQCKSLRQRENQGADSNTNKP